VSGLHRVGVAVGARRLCLCDGRVALDHTAVLAEDVIEGGGEVVLQHLCSGGKGDRVRQQANLRNRREDNKMQLQQSILTAKEECTYTGHGPAHEQRDGGVHGQVAQDILPNAP